MMPAWARTRWRSVCVQNVTIASIPSTLSPGLAPPGKALVHAYTAGNEPYEIWEGLDRRSPEYKRLKARQLYLWLRLRVLGCVCARQVTHLLQRFLCRAFCLSM